MSETLERIEREIAREVLDAVLEAIGHETELRTSVDPSRTGQLERKAVRRQELFSLDVVARVERKYGVSREPRGGYE